jgi:ADP-heptose:LPS heptosyltransferase
MTLKVLFFSHDGKLGDAVVNTAFVAGLKRWNPDTAIHATVAGATAAFWGADDRIARTWQLDRRKWPDIIRLGLALRRERLDYLVTWLRPRSEKNRVLLWLAAPGKVIDLRDFNAGPVRPRIEHCAEALAQIGAPASPLAYDVHMPVRCPDIDARYPPDRELILVNLFAADAERNIPHDAAAALLLGLQRTAPGALLCLLCTSATEARANAAIAATGVGELVNCDGGLARLFRICQRADLVISPDTAIVHIASAFDRPVIGIYQNDGVKPVLWGPRGTRVAVVVSQSAHTVQGFDVAEVLEYATSLRRKPVRDGGQGVPTLR